MDETPEGDAVAKSYPDHFKIRHYMSQHKISVGARGLHATLTAHCDNYIHRNITRTSLLKEFGLSNPRGVKKLEDELTQHKLLEVVELGGGRVTYKPTRNADALTWSKRPPESINDTPTWSKRPPPPGQIDHLHLIEYKSNINTTVDSPKPPPPKPKKPRSKIVTGPIEEIRGDPDVDEWLAVVNQKIQREHLKRLEGNTSAFRRLITKIRLWEIGKGKESTTASGKANRMNKFNENPAQFMSPAVMTRREAERAAYDSLQALLSSSPDD